MRTADEVRRNRKTGFSAGGGQRTHQYISEQQRIDLETRRDLANYVNRRSKKAARDQEKEQSRVVGQGASLYDKPDSNFASLEN